MAGTLHSGRRPEAQSIHRLRGTDRADRHGGFSAPEPPKGTPESPIELTGLALAEWERMVARLDVSGSISKVDDAAIYQYARLFAETEALVEKQERTEALVDTLEKSVGDVEKEDRMALFLEISKMTKLAAGYDNKIRQGRMAIRQFLCEFGLTPSSRARVKLPEKKPVSKVEQFRRPAAG